ncbi:hypothetical protein [Acinetobacter puyangensis]|uniref:hypothetical protein n=1 Tax=Acinetobacter puyangensis TaxID=1096779 RepID=UPI003A4DE6EB
MLKTSFNTTTVTPVDRSYINKNDKQVTQFETTLLAPVVHKLVPNASASMPVEQMNAVLKQCAETSQEVEIEYTVDRDRYNNLTYSIYNVKPVPKKQA